MCLRLFSFRDSKIETVSQRLSVAATCWVTVTVTGAGTGTAGHDRETRTLNV